MRDQRRYDDVDRYIEEFLKDERKRHRRILAVLGIVILALLATTGWFYMQPADPYGLLDAAPGREPGTTSLSGPFIAEPGRGLVMPGGTDLASTLGYELTGPLEITVTAGRYVSPGGDRYDLLENTAVQLEPHPDESTAHAVVLVHRDGRTDVVADRVLRPGEDETEADIRQEYGNESVEQSPIPGQVRMLIRYDDLVLPPGATTLEGREIPVFYVYDGD